MTFADYWLSVCSANPELPKADIIRLSPDSYRAALRRAFTAGQLSPPEIPKQPDFMEQFFRKGFGK